MGTPTPGVTPPDEVTSVGVVGLQQQQHNERNDLSYNQVFKKSRQNFVK
jgi:hypothetical protein